MAYKQFNTARKVGESDIKYYTRLAKAADQRLVRLEGYQHDEGFRKVTKWAYASAMNDLKSKIFGQSGQKIKRFNKKLPLNSDGSINQKIYNARLNSVKRFLESATSSKQGIVSVYKKKADTINKNYGTDFTWEDLAKYFNQGYREKAEQYGSSKTVLRAIAQIQHMDDEMIEKIRKYKDKDIRIGDDIVNEVVKKLLLSNNVDITDLR